MFRPVALSTLAVLELVKMKFVSAVFVRFRRAAKTYSMVSVRPARFVVTKPGSLALAAAWAVVPWLIAVPITRMGDARPVRFAAMRRT